MTLSAAAAFFDRVVATLNGGASVRSRAGIFSLHRFPGYEGRNPRTGEVVPVPILCSVTCGAPIQLLPGEDKRDFLERARAAIIALRHVH